MKKIANLCFLTGFVILSTGCDQQQTGSKLSDAEILHKNQDLLTQVIIYDVFTPPVAARLYVYTSLASYEAIRFSKEDAASITEQLHGFAKIPEPEKGKSYDYSLAAC